MASLSFVSGTAFSAFAAVTMFACGAAPSFADDATFTGNASWYGVPFHGKKTASGEIFDMNKLSGAHKTLAFTTKVLVENPKNGKSVIIKVNDRGPFVKSRIMDLSRKGAEDLGYLSHGTAHLDFTILPAKPAPETAVKKE
jgi:rare lipoprotein A